MTLYGSLCSPINQVNNVDQYSLRVLCITDSHMSRKYRFFHLNPLLWEVLIVFSLCRRKQANELVTFAMVAGGASIQTEIQELESAIQSRNLPGGLAAAIGSVDVQVQINLTQGSIE